MNILTNKWSYVLLTFFIVFSLMILSNCETTNDKTQYEWRYEIHGQVRLGDGTSHEAIWYTDTIEIGDNFVSYKNSDGSEVVIAAPYTLIDHKYQKVIEDTKPAF